MIRRWVKGYDVALTQADLLNQVQGRLGQVVAGPPPGDPYFNSVVQSILPFLPTLWAFASTRVQLPYNFSKVRLVQLETTRLAMQELLGPLMDLVNSRLDSFLAVQARERYENVSSALAMLDKEIAAIEVRVQANRLPVVGTLLQRSPVDLTVPRPHVGAGQPQHVLPPPWRPNPNWPGFVGDPSIYGPWADEPGNVEAF